MEVKQKEKEREREERRAISIKIPDTYRINLDMHEIFKNKMITALKAARCSRKYRMGEWMGGGGVERK